MMVEQKSFISEEAHEEGIHFIHKFEGKGDFFRSLEVIVPLQNLYQQDFGFDIRQLLSNTTSWASTKGQESIRMQIVALLLPSLRPKDLWILVELWIVVITHRLDEDSSSFWNGNIGNKVIFLSLSHKYSISWSIIPQRLIDSHIDIGHFFRF